MDGVKQFIYRFDPVSISAACAPTFHPRLSPCIRYSETAHEIQYSEEKSLPSRCHPDVHLIEVYPHTSERPPVSLR